MKNPDLISLLKSKAEAVQTIVSTIKTIEDAFRYAVETTRAQNGKTLAATGLQLSDKELLKNRCKTAGLKLLEPPFRIHAGEIHTALTPVDWGIAETGTLVLDSTAEDVRIATTLAETHIAILPASKIKPDTDAIENDLNAVLKTDAASYTSFITGASRTADIERVLAIGVHGPQELHILILKENNA